MGIFAPIGRMKNAAIGAAVKKWFNHTQKRFGHMTSIQIDSNQKTIRVELDLKGETSLITLEVKDYKFTEEGGETFIEVGEFDVSREWMKQLAQQFVTDEMRRFKVPPAVKIVL